MPTQEVARAVRPATLLRVADRRPGAVLLDGGGLRSWGDGRVLYTDSPRATLEVLPSGWGRWRRGDSVQWRHDPPLRQWQDFLVAAAAALPAPADPHAAGVLTVLSYDLKHWIEHLPRRLPWPETPLLYSAVYDWRYTADCEDGSARIAARSQPQLQARLRWYEENAAGMRIAPPVPWQPCCPKPRMSRAAYLRMIERVREYIAAGDVYQVNLAQSFELPGPPPDAAALFEAWCAAYPMPFGAFVDAGDWIAVSNSPECLLTVEGESVATYPIKGTRRLAGGDDALDMAEPLSRDPKERAEHVMIVDLERNDLGRVCEPGTVEVGDFAAVSAYPLLFHMVSEVRGRLRPGTPVAEVLRATFPGGSVTGAPKIRAMQIIEELEPVPRGLYTGSIGWTDLNGQGRFNIAIRTAVSSAAGLVYHAGGGIVADSNPQREYDETMLKSEALFRAFAKLGGTA
jgi:anthranilate/para-aminobenzoate synthase component I